MFSLFFDLLFIIKNCITCAFAKLHLDFTLIQGLAILSPTTSTRDKMRLAFLLTDLDAVGGVSLQNLQATLAFVASRHPGHGGGDGDDDGDGGSNGGGDVTLSVPMLSRSESSIARAFDQCDLDGDSLLSYAGSV